MESSPGSNQHVLVTMDLRISSILTERKKLLPLNVNLKKDDFVLVCDKNLKRSHWPLGRIVKTLSGPDNVVRVVKAQMKNSSYVQLVASLALLECGNNRVSVV